MVCKFALGASAMIALAGTADAQLLVGNDDFGSGVTNAWNVDPSDASASALWGDGNPEVWGMTYDPGSNNVYVSDGTELYGGLFGGGAPSFIADITDPTTGDLLSMTGMAWASGALYGSRTVGDEGIYKIDVATGEANLILGVDPLDYDFGGLAFNPMDGLFYGTNDDTSLASGLYSIDVFGGGGINLVTPYPAGENDIDGLAIGNGVAYLVEEIGRAHV